MIALWLLVATATGDTGGMPAALKHALTAAGHPRMRWGDISDVRIVLSRSYVMRSWRPLWSMNGRLTQPGRQVLAELDSARARGLDPHEAHTQSVAEFARLLPEGLATPGSRLCTAVEHGDPVARLWLGVRDDHAGAAFVWDVEVLPEHRGRGIGRATMLAAEDLARELGCDRLGLNVFGHNPVARGLYESLGYATTSLQMSKDLRPPAST